MEAIPRTLQVFLSHKHNRGHGDLIRSDILVRHRTANVGTALGNAIEAILKAIRCGRGLWRFLDARDNVSRIDAVWLLVVFVAVEIEKHPFR